MIRIIKEPLMFLTAPLYSATGIFIACSATILAIDVSPWFALCIFALPLIDDKITDLGVGLLEEYIDEEEKIK